MNVEDWVVMFGGCMQSGYDAVSRAAVFQSELDWVVKTQKNIVKFIYSPMNVNIPVSYKKKLTKTSSLLLNITPKKKIKVSTNKNLYIERWLFWWAATINRTELVWIVEKEPEASITILYKWNNIFNNEIE